MPKFVMVVTSSSLPGREVDYATWYDNTHIKDICSVEGVTSGRRIVALPEASPNPPPGSQLAIYEIETDDPSKVMAEIGQRSQSGEFEMTDVIDLQSAQIWFYRQD